MDNNKKDFKFDKMASTYDDGFAGKFSRKFYNALLSCLDLKPSSKVLDVGCGTGYLLRKMADSQEIQGYGIDVEQKMIDIAKDKCPEMFIQIAACEKTPFDDGLFDVLVACMAYHHFSDKAGFAKEAARILKVGGYLYIVDPRFPFLIRKTINGIARLFRVSGKFFTPQEMTEDFCKMGFEPADVFCDGLVQVVALRKV
jgi:ubiquinone/menaquinone biosynthesis C-methylase UbiE